MNGLYYDPGYSFTYTPYQYDSQFYANQAYYESAYDPYIGSYVRSTQSLVHSLPGYSPGGWSGSANPYADSINYINYTDSYLLPLANQTYGAVSNTGYYEHLSPNDIFNTYEYNAQILGGTSATSNSLGAVLDSVGFNNSQFI
ncbi:MAG: hypothetical protein AAFQ80_15070 [Cyanobacteria bacterium J06621_8]